MNEIQTSSAHPDRRKTIILVILSVLFLFLEIFGALPNISTPIERLELSASDTAFRLRGQIEPHDEIVIVAIDDQSLVWTDERWPWQRVRFAEIINWLNDAGAKVIALDMFLFDAAENPLDDEALVNAFANANASVSVNQIFQDEFTITHEPPLPIYQHVLSAYGITEIERDDDAIVRSVNAFKTFSGEVYYNWAFEIARLYLDIPSPTNPSAASVMFNNSIVPLNNQGRLLIDFRGPAGSYNTYSAAFVPLGDYPAEAFRDKIVLIGASSETLQDLYPTPFSATTLTPGVEIVANSVATLLSGQHIRLTPPWVTLLLIIVMAILAWLLVTRVQEPTAAFIIAGGGAFAYYALRQFIYFQSGWQFAIVSPMLILFLGVIIPTLEEAVNQEVEKRRVRNLFGQFIAPQMVNQLLETQDISSLNKRTELTILFSDIRGFTTISERLSPEQVVELLNPYLHRMTEVIHNHGGTVDKYEGDAIVAFFGEPIPFNDHAIRAARAALEMRRELKALTDQWKLDGRFTDEFEMGVGINTGEVFVGLLGSEARVNYTIIGDAANLAARLQDQTKELGYPILISGETYQHIKGKFVAQFEESKILKGKSEPVEIWKLVSEKGTGLTV